MKRIPFERYALPVIEFEHRAFREFLKRRARLVWGLNRETSASSLFFGRFYLKDIIAGRANEFDTRLAFVSPGSLRHFFTSGEEEMNWSVDPDYWHHFLVNEKGNLVPKAANVPLAFVFSLDWAKKEHEYLLASLKQLKGDFDVHSGSGSGGNGFPFDLPLV